MRTFKLTFLFLSLIILITHKSGLSQELNITAMVKASNPNFDRELQEICQNYCLGNMSRGWLQAVTYQKINNKHFELKAEARFQNREQTDPITAFGVQISDGGDLYDQTVIVKARVRVDKSTCVSILEDIWVENDYHDIFTALVQNENLQGKNVTLKKCNDYLR
jgi:hypothetical protein